MRKILLSLTVLAGVVAASSGSQAAGFASPIPQLAPPAQVQTVQYYGGWREREWRRHERHEAWRRHHERMRWERYHHHRRW